MDCGSMTSQIELIKAHVLNRLADAADPFLQVTVDNGTGLKEFASAAFGMLLQVGLQLLKRFGQMQGDGDRGETIIDPATAPAGAPGDERLLYKSQNRITRSIRSTFGSADFSVYVYHIRHEPNSAIAFRPFDAALQMAKECRWSSLRLFDWQRSRKRLSVREIAAWQRSAASIASMLFTGRQ
jgi:hypothetical protein